MTPYTDAAIRGELSKLSSTTNGNRNDTLFKSAARIYEFVEAGDLAEGEADELLWREARKIGLDPAEIKSTLKSASKRAAGNPAKIPETHERHTAAPPPKAYTGLADYAHDHGATADVFRAAGWRETKHVGRPALTFTTATGTRIRYLDGAEPRYQSPPGYRRSWYWLAEAIALAQASDQPLVLCNGEASTVAAQSHGVAAFAVAGGSEKPTIPDELAAELGAVYEGPILVALDCDKTGRADAPQIAAQLQAAGYTARAVDLNGGLGFDLADFCRLHESDSVAALGTLPEVSTEGHDTDDTRRPRLWHASDLGELPPVEYLDEDRTIVARGLNVLFGPSGGGKSFYALAKALEIAQTGNVIYFAGEGSSGYHGRVKSWCQQHGRGPGGLYFWFDSLPLLDPAAVAAFIAEIAPLQPRMVVIDTQARAMLGGDENSARDMGLLVEACATIQRATGAATYDVHHVGKSGTSERGSSALRGAADQMVELTNDDGLISVECVKAKDGKPFEPRYLRLVEVGASCVLMPAANVTQRDAPLSPRERSILETLALPTFLGAGCKAVNLMEILGIPKKGLYRSLSSLMRRKFVGQTVKGDPFFLLQAGADAIGERGATPERAAGAETGEESDAEFPHSTAQVSLVSPECHEVSETPSVTVSPVSHPYRGDTDTTLTPTKGKRSNKKGTPWPGWVDDLDPPHPAGSAALTPAAPGAAVRPGQVEDADLPDDLPSVPAANVAVPDPVDLIARLKERRQAEQEVT